MEIQTCFNLKHHNETKKSLDISSRLNMTNSRWQATGSSLSLFYVLRLERLEVKLSK